MEWIYKANYPARFESLMRLTRRLGRCPWEINSDYIDDALGTENQNLNGQQWSEQELIILTQAIVFIQFLSTITLAVGLIPENECDLLNIKLFLEFKEKYDQ